MELPKIETVNGIPDAARGPGGGEMSPFTELMRALKPPVGQKYQTFFVAADEPGENITDEDERYKELRSNCSKLANRFNGLGRRIVKGDANYKFAFRVGRENPEDDASPLGVRVYRVKAGS
jgi:hypothetical protein